MRDMERSEYKWAGNSDVNAAWTSDRSISLKLLSALLSDSLNYLPEKTVIMSRLMLYIFFQVWSATAGFPAPWFFPVTTEKFPTAAIICIYWCYAFHIKMLFYPQYTSYCGTKRLQSWILIFFHYYRYNKNM